VARFILNTTCYTLAVVMFILPTVQAVCEENEDTFELPSLLVVPVVTYSTDTGYAGGFGLIKSYHSSERQASTVQVVIMYTQKKQFQSEIKWEHHFPNETDRVLVDLIYNKYPSEFYGIGNDTSNENTETYTPEYFVGRFGHEKTIVARWKLKTIVRFRNQSLTGTERGGTIKTPSVPWSRGRFDIGPGIGILWDSRDNTYSAHTGLFAKLEYFGVLYQDEGKAFNTLSFDVRKYFNPASGLVLAYQCEVRDSRGDIPFYFYPDLGGEERLRGYESNRFLGEKAVLFQHDIRFPIWGLLGGVAFVATGKVADRLNDVFSGTYHTAGGGGLRFLFNKKDNLVLRLDVAYGSDSRGVYFTFGEAY